MTASRNFDLSGFDALNVTTGIRAIVTTGSPHSLRIEARDDETIDRLDVSVAGGRLHIGYFRNFIDFIFSGGFMDLLRFGGDLGVVAYVAVPALNGAEASSGGRIEVSNVKSDRFRAEASSGGEVSVLGFAGGDVRGMVSSGGRLELEGVATELDAAASSGGILRGDRLQSQRGRLDASSGGRIEAAVSTRLRAAASSGGYIDITGNPSDRDVNASSGGNVSFH